MARLVDLASGVAARRRADVRAGPLCDKDRDRAVKWAFSRLEEWWHFAGLFDLNSSVDGLDADGVVLNLDPALADQVSPHAIGELVEIEAPPAEGPPGQSGSSRSEFETSRTDSASFRLLPATWLVTFIGPSERSRWGNSPGTFPSCSSGR